MERGFLQLDTGGGCGLPTRDRTRRLRPRTADGCVVRGERLAGRRGARSGTRLRAGPAGAEAAAHAAFAWIRRRCGRARDCTVVRVSLAAFPHRWYLFAAYPVTPQIVTLIANRILVACRATDRNRSVAANTDVPPRFSMSVRYTPEAVRTASLQSRG